MTYASVTISGEQILYECPECGALVRWRMITEHDVWHSGSQFDDDLLELKQSLSDLAHTVKNISHNQDSLQVDLDRLGEDVDSLSNAVSA